MHKSESHGNGGIYAKVIADSIANGIRLTTLELRFHRYILSQFNTHRMFSRNASSSRAIPVQKNIDAVLSDPAMPIHWGKNKPGMQAIEEIENIAECEESWKLIAEFNAEASKELIKAGLHKQIVNRVLEPFSHIKVICTATEWDGFFKLRLHDDAQPEIKMLAKFMKEAMDNSAPNELNVGEWHLPYVDVFPGYVSPKLRESIRESDVKCSTARIARVSYNNHDGSNPVVEKDIKLHDDLLASGHMSPFEHIATPMEHINGNERPWIKGYTHLDRNGNFWSGNLRGWVQYRQLVEGK